MSGFVSPQDKLAAYRLIDANWNRAAEGLRVAEDYCRFAMNDGHLTRLCKQLRHDLATAMQAVDSGHLAACRETQQDVGTTATTVTESRRGSLRAIAIAAWPRVQQALRVIEECLKLVAPAAAGQVESLRYQSYTLAKACQITGDSQQRLADARLYVLLDGGSSECEFALRAQTLIEAGAHILQLRDKQLDDRTLLARARLMRRVIDEAAARVQGSGFGVQGSGFGVQGSGDRGQESAADLGAKDSAPSTRHSVRCTQHQESVVPELHKPAHHSPLTTHFPRPTTHHPLLILNDRPDLAVLARADGVHVGQEELSVHDVRQIVGPDLLVGVSTHNIEQARQAVLDGANYLGCGPTFPSGTKRFDHFPGLEFLRQVAAEISLPAFAIGGISLERLDEVMSNGIHRVAVSGAITAATDGPSVVRSFLTLVERRNSPEL